MKLLIEYESSWRNSFLDGSNNIKPQGKERSYVASMTKLKKQENYKIQDVTIDTVMGILNRLIGDRRKLYQARNKEYEDSYYFEKIEDKVTFIDNISVVNNEIIFLRNMKRSFDQNSFTGAVITDDPIFQSDFSKYFWGILALDFDELCDFIINDTIVEARIDSNPISICERFEQLNKYKAVKLKDNSLKALAVMQEHFEDISYMNNKRLVPCVSFYCSALYLQLMRLEQRFNVSSVRTKSGVISGISKRGFTKKDFMYQHTTGNKKIIFGNPYIRKEFVEKEGQITHVLKKCSGNLEINIDIDINKSIEIKEMIENAGVSCFRLGKKGLAYLSKITV